MQQYTARFVRKISPRDTDTKGPFVLADGAFADSRKLGAALRTAQVLGKGERLRGFRVEGDRVVAFPAGRSLFASIVITAA